EVSRASGSGVFTTVTTTAAMSFNDATVAASTVYVYKVRAIDAAARTSPFSTPDPATTIAFTDDPLIEGVTPIKVAHLIELREAINGLRATAGLTPATFTDPTLTSSIRVKAVHLQELRTALTAARSAFGMSAISFTDATLIAGATEVKSTHVQDLRNGVK
ncbi:MAG TPA: hypothetical protein VF215_00690, partial [Thermoanaerobaculia bacterium]